jgi:hypothetical protein
MGSQGKPGSASRINSLSLLFNPEKNLLQSVSYIMLHHSLGSRRRVHCVACCYVRPSSLMYLQTLWLSSTEIRQRPHQHWPVILRRRRTFSYTQGHVRRS